MRRLRIKQEYTMRDVYFVEIPAALVKDTQAWTEAIEQALDVAEPKFSDIIDAGPDEISELVCCDVCWAADYARCGHADCACHREE